MKKLLPPLALVLAAASAPAQTVTIGPLVGDTAAQAPLGTDATSRFATDVMDESVLAALSSGSSGLLVALGDTVTLQYLGTSAARDASLSFGSDELFQTRSGCSYATALMDDFCIIDTVGRSRTLSGLSAGAALGFSLLAQAQPLGPASQQRSTAQRFDSATDARLLGLGNGQALLGFEEGGDASYNDMVFLLSGVSLVAVPEPSAAGLLALGLLSLALRARSRRS